MFRIIGKNGVDYGLARLIRWRPESTDVGLTAVFWDWDEPRHFTGTAMMSDDKIVKED